MTREKSPCPLHAVCVYFSLNNVHECDKSFAHFKRKQGRFSDVQRLQSIKELRVAAHYQTRIMSNFFKPLQPTCSPTTYKNYGQEYCFRDAVVDNKLGQFLSLWDDERSDCFSSSRQNIKV